MTQVSAIPDFGAFGYVPAAPAPSSFQKQGWKILVLAAVVALLAMLLIRLFIKMNRRKKAVPPDESAAWPRLA